MNRCITNGTFYIWGHVKSDLVGPFLKVDNPSIKYEEKSIEETNGETDYDELHYNAEFDGPDQDNLITVDRWRKNECREI